MDILIGIIPAIFWGFAPIATKKTGGSPIQQLVGNTFGSLLLAGVIILIFRPAISIPDFIWCFFSGAAWALGQLMQYISFTKMNVSSAVPSFAGIQMIGTSLFGIFFLNEWVSTSSKILGFLCMIALFIGILFTAHQDKHEQRRHNKHEHHIGVICLVVGGIAYTFCDVLPRVPNASGLSGILPQTIGQIVTSLIISRIIVPKQWGKFLIGKKTVENTFCGLLSGGGTFFYLVSSKINGVATGFPLSQLNSVISVIAGILFLHEHKDHLEMIYTEFGLILIVLSAFIIGHIQ
ncbi:putative sugar uptake protein [Philodulcilactobacillus myokoensis]|uniref:Sugar uptake protein n=1 Tax=Philodulcilactobacillus myokoensis TaxID=2929573 RepID=A0A9W6B2G5_9LACO|nr:GRP family sugar transporter [Philodulcilactobacillus myokoensis]GLB47311.1 putative sugar uptake protein [Philodulcilactobacillus myokoensis]